MVLERGRTRAALRHREGIQVDLRVVEPACFGTALAYFTGSKQHNIRVREMAMKRGLKISEYGVFRESSGRRVAGATEEEVYARRSALIAPELREDAGEIEAALADRCRPGARASSACSWPSTPTRTSSTMSRTSSSGWRRRAVPGSRRRRS